MLLGKRIVEPQPDWWYVEGRMKPGERPEQSIARLVQRELHLVVEPSRFQPLGTHSYAWARRQQAPMDNGTCHISVVLTLVLPSGEAERIHMDEKEHAEFRWFSVSEIIAGDNFHPALRASARDIWQRQAWQKLVREVRIRDSTESIAETAKQLVSLSAQFREFLYKNKNKNRASTVSNNVKFQKYQLVTTETSNPELASLRLHFRNDAQKLNLASH